MENATINDLLAVEKRVVAEMKHFTDGWSQNQDAKASNIEESYRSKFTAIESKIEEVKQQDAVKKEWAEKIKEIDDKLKVQDEVKEKLKEIDDKMKVQDELKVYVTQEIERMEILIAQQKGGEKEKSKSKRVMTSRRDFAFLPKYNGKHEDFDEWKFKIVTFLSEEVEFKELLLKLDDLKEIPDPEAAKGILKQIQDCHGQDDDPHWINHQLYQVLSLNLEGKALNMIKNVKTFKESNGVLGWCKLMQDCSSMTAQRLQGLAQKVYSPKRAKNYGEVIANIEEWETNVALFEKIEERPLNQTTKIYAIRQIAPEELEKDVVRLSSTLTSYDQVKSYIFEQVATRRDAKGVQKGPVAMDLNVMEMMTNLFGGPEEKEIDENKCGLCDEENAKEKLKQMFTFYKGKAGGKGFGGKGFNGTCHHCGEFGHRLNECRKKDAEMSKGKGKGGKGDPFALFGKGNFGGSKGYFGGKGKGKFGGKSYDGEKGYGGGKGFGGKGYGGYGKGGGIYGFWGEEEPGKTNWTLNLSKSRAPDAPPGLLPFNGKNKFDVLEENEDDVNQRQADLEEMEKAYDNEFPKQPLGNYSKRSQKPKFEKFVKAKTKVLNLFEKYGADPKELYPVIHKNTDEWQYIEGVMDSGAEESVTYPSMCLQYPVVSSEGSRKGQKYTSASGDEIPNLGEQVLPVVTMDGWETNARYQSADVSKPLNSISEICDGGGPEGQFVLFSKWGGLILNLESGRRMSFDRQGGIYTMGMWVKPPSMTGPASGFTRPGA